MREITTHKVNGCNDALTVTAKDGPGPGGASHCYEIGGYSRPVEYVADDATGETATGTEVAVTLDFQNGPVAEAGTNGVTHEALLAVLIDRLEGFQSGPFASPHNALALSRLKGAMNALHTRTLERAARGVEGTHSV